MLGIDAIVIADSEQMMKPLEGTTGDELQDDNKHRKKFMEEAFGVRWCNGKPSVPKVAKTSKVITETVYRQRILLLGKWNSMPVSTKKERSEKLAFKQSNLNGYKLNRSHRVVISNQNVKELKRRPDQEASFEDEPWSCVERSVCHANNIFDVINSLHFPDHLQPSELHLRIRMNWSNVPERFCRLYVKWCPLCRKLKNTDS